VSGLSGIVAPIMSWSGWTSFSLVPATASSHDLFGVGEYLASLALFLVVMTISDFRYAYRLALTRFDLRVLGYWLGLTVGLLILVTDIWFGNRWPIPKLLSNENWIKGLLALVYLAYVFYVVYVAVIRYPKFARNNAKQFFDANYHYIHQGSSDRLQIIAEELRRSVPDIVGCAAQIGDDPRAKPTLVQAYASDFLLLIADKRFCKAVVEKSPAFGFAVFFEAQKYLDRTLHIFQFARNIGQEFIRNTNSSFYQEDSGYYSGYVGYARPTTNLIFGSYKFVEKCAADGASPLDTDYLDISRFNAQQMKGFARASLAFFKSYLVATKGRVHPHSYAATRMFGSFKSSVSGLYELNGVEGYSELAAFGRLTATTDFVKEAIELVEKEGYKPNTWRVGEILRSDVYDELARLMFDIIFAATSVTSPIWTCWSVQHNTVWDTICRLNQSRANRTVALKVRRLLYEEIKRMDEFANFKGARIIGYCLNVLGLTLVDRHNGFHKEFYPLQAAVLAWTKKNYRRLLSDHPKVAEACLQGSVTYDAKQHRLVKTYGNDTRKEPSREFLALD